MFGEIVKDVYMGKWEVGMWVNGKRVGKESVVKDIGLGRLVGNKLGDYGRIGNFREWELEVKGGGNEKLFMRGIGKKSYELDL